MPAILKPVTTFFLITIGCCLLLCISTTAKAQSAQDMQKQMDDLKQQIKILQTELTTLKSVINASSNGNLTVNNGAARADATGGQYSQTVGGNSNITVVANKTETVGINMTSNIGNNLSVSAGKSYLVTTGKDIMIEAGDQIVIKSGNAFIILKKNGDIELKGNLILPKVSKDILIKGSKIE